MAEQKVYLEEVNWEIPQFPNLDQIPSLSLNWNEGIVDARYSAEDRRNIKAVTANIMLNLRSGKDDRVPFLLQRALMRFPNSDQLYALKAFIAQDHSPE